MRKLLLLTVVAMLALLTVPAQAKNHASSQFPDVIELPDGWFPEGIAVGRGSTFFVGSLADGSIYKGDLRTGEGSVLTAGTTGPFSTVGIEVDNKNRIWVAGGPTGSGRVYDGNTGALLAAYQFTGPFESFINDVVVTNDAAYFTDSGTRNNPNPAQFQFAGSPRLFVVELGPGKSLTSGFSTLPLGVPDLFFPNLNGIETLPGDNQLVVGHNSAEQLFTVNPSNGDAESLDVGQPLPGNDGLTRRGSTLYVVQAGLAQVSAVKLQSSTSGVVDAVLPVPGAETPTTAGLFGGSLYLPDARFFSGVDPYNIYRIDAKG